MIIIDNRILRGKRSWWRRERFWCIWRRRLATTRTSAGSRRNVAGRPRDIRTSSASTGHTTSDHSDAHNSHLKSRNLSAVRPYHRPDRPQSRHPSLARRVTSLFAHVTGRDVTGFKSRRDSADTSATSSSGGRRSISDGLCWRYFATADTRSSRLLSELSDRCAAYTERCESIEVISVTALALRCYRSAGGRITTAGDRGSRAGPGWTGRAAVLQQNASLSRTHTTTTWTCQALQPHRIEQLMLNNFAPI